jgi:hypothetical protein
MSSWDQAIREEKLGLVWRNRKKISEIINDYLYLPFFLLIILWSAPLGEGRGGLKGKRELDGKWSLVEFTGWGGDESMIKGGIGWEGEAPGGRWKYWIGRTEH